MEDKKISELCDNLAMQLGYAMTKAKMFEKEATRLNNLVSNQEEEIYNLRAELFDEER